MKLLPRRTPPAAGDAAGAEAGTDTGTETGAESAAGGKGRPTPKRRDSVPQRGPVTAPKTRKEAYARQKQQTREARAARTARRSGTMTVQQRRQAMRAGDPSALSRRDQGLTRELARDWVDSHRMLSNYLLILFPILIISGFVPVLAVVAPAALLVLVLEWVLVGRRIRKLAVERFGSAQGGALGIGFYAGSRAYLPRRWRLPAPRVDRGDEI